MSTVVEVWADTGESVVRPMTPQEEAQQAADNAAAKAAAAAEAERVALAISARQKIAESSGLTPEEMAALGF